MPHHKLPNYYARSSRNQLINLHRKNGFFHGDRHQLTALLSIYIHQICHSLLKHFFTNENLLPQLSSASTCLSVREGRRVIFFNCR
jgi:iron-sulfur cluster repair protein YtfE (RIC family)